LNEEEETQKMKTQREDDEIATNADGFRIEVDNSGSALYRRSWADNCGKHMESLAYNMDE
jgi:hypothetical protein